MLLTLATRILPVWRFVKSNPMLVALALCALWGLYQRHEANKWHNRALACQTASQAAAAQTKAMREAEAKAYQEKAIHADQEHAAALADARAATADYIRTHRVRPSGGVSAPVAIGQAEDTRQPEAVPSDSFVSVSESDLQACTAATVYAVTAHDYLMSIGE